MSLSQALGAAAPPYQITHNGRTFRFSALTQAAKAAFGRRMVEAAMAAAALAPESVRGLAISTVAREAGAGLYDFYGAYCVEAMCGPSGMVLLACVLSDSPQEDMIELMAERGPEVLGVLDVITLESLPAKVRGAVLAEREKKRQEEAKHQAGADPARPTSPATA